MNSGNCDRWFVILLAALFGSWANCTAAEQVPRTPGVNPPHVSTDKSVNYGYDIVYVRAPRMVRDSDGELAPAEIWPDAGAPGRLKATTDLMLLHPDGSQSLLVAGGEGAIADPYVSFDARWVYYSHFHDLSGHGGADVYRVHVESRKVVRLTHQQWTP